MAFSQSDTLWVEFKDLPGYEHSYYGKHPEDPHEESYYPFDGAHSYTIDKGYKVNGVKLLYFFHTSHGPAGTGFPFYFVTLSNEAIKKIEFLRRDFFEARSYLDLIFTFWGSDKVIMLYDATQPPGDRQYVVRVYFSFDAYE
jgi:hypothetical protein